MPIHKVIHSVGNIWNWDIPCMVYPKPNIAESHLLVYHITEDWVTVEGKHQQAVVCPKATLAKLY